MGIGAVGCANQMERMERKSLVSTSLKSAGYDADNKTIEVEFVEGGIYRYFDVPKEIYEALLKAESKGRFYVAEIRDKYMYEKIST